MQICFVIVFWLLKLFNVGGGWIDGFGAQMEWYWLGKTEVLKENPVLVSSYSQSPTRNELGSNMDRRENGLMSDPSSSHNLSWI